MSDTALESVNDHKRRDDKWFTLRMVLEIAIAVIGFFLVTTLNGVSSQLKEHEVKLEGHSAELSAMKATADARDKATTEQICDIRASQLGTSTRLEAWMTKLSDKVDRIAEKIGTR